MTVATYESRAEIERIDIAALGALPIVGVLRALHLVRFADGTPLTPLRTSHFRS